MNSLSLDDIKTLPLDMVRAYALRHVRRLEQKRKHSQVYNTEPRVWQRNRTHYYQRRDIFHPVWNPNGSVKPGWRTTWEAAAHRAIAMRQVQTNQTSASKASHAWWKER